MGRAYIRIRLRDIDAGQMPPRQGGGEGIGELAESLKTCGQLSPLLVKRAGKAYQLVAGCRRYRAMTLLGWKMADALLIPGDGPEPLVLSLVENIQRENLTCFEEAEGYRAILSATGMTQEALSRLVGKSPSAVANKLRLLKLPEDVLETLRDRGLTERHGRALLRLPDEESQRAALGKIIEKDMTVAAAESYVDELLAAGAQPPAAAKRTFVMKDVRLFLNSVSRSFELMRQGGVEADMQRRETDDALILTISIPKRG